MPMRMVSLLILAFGFASATHVFKTLGIWEALAVAVVSLAGSYAFARLRD